MRAHIFIYVLCLVLLSACAPEENVQPYLSQKAEHRESGLSFDTIVHRRCKIILTNHGAIVTEHCMDDAWRDEAILIVLGKTKVRSINDAERIHKPYPLRYPLEAAYLVPSLGRSPKQTVFVNAPTEGKLYRVTGVDTALYLPHGNIDGDGLTFWAADINKYQAVQESPNPLDRADRFEQIALDNGEGICTLDSGRAVYDPDTGALIGIVVAAEGKDGSISPCDPIVYVTRIRSVKPVLGKD